MLNSLQTAKSLRTEEQRGRFELIVAASQGVTHYALGRHEPFATLNSMQFDESLGGGATCSL